MLNHLRKYLDHRTRPQMIALGLASLGSVGVLDYLTGYELSSSVFYLVPVVMITWYMGQRAGYAICGLSAAVWLLGDYAAGNIYSHWLIPVWNMIALLMSYLVTAYLVGELKKYMLRIEKLATTDGLTRILNARAFKDISARMLNLASRQGHPAVLGYIDIDNFKGVNDHSGHSEGDRVLQSVASTLTRYIRGNDVVGRIGGDEFAVLMLEISHVDARIAFDRIREELLEDAAARGWPIGFSIGVAVFSKAPTSIDQALGTADHLMYEVKWSGKNRVVYQEIVN